MFAKNMANLDDFPIRSDDPGDGSRSRVSQQRWRTCGAEPKRPRRASLPTREIGKVAVGNVSGNPHRDFRTRDRVPDGRVEAVHGANSAGERAEESERFDLGFQGKTRPDGRVESMCSPSAWRTPRLSHQTRRPRRTGRVACRPTAMANLQRRAGASSNGLPSRLEDREG